MQSGRAVLIRASDAASFRDFQAFAKQTGHELAGQGARDGHSRLLLQRR